MRALENPKRYVASKLLDPVLHWWTSDRACRQSATKMWRACLSCRIMLEFCERQSFNILLHVCHFRTWTWRIRIEHYLWNPFLDENQGCSFSKVVVSVSWQTTSISVIREPAPTLLENLYGILNRPMLAKSFLGSVTHSTLIRKFWSFGMLLHPA